MSSETELKENLRNLAENNQDLKRQLQAFRSELVEREMDLHKVKAPRNFHLIL